jgi:hypothetical protein
MTIWKTRLVKIFALAQFAVMAIDVSLQSHGIPKDAHSWLAILGSAAVWIALHHAPGAASESLQSGVVQSTIAAKE